MLELLVHDHRVLPRGAEDGAVVVGEGDADDLAEQLGHAAGVARRHVPRDARFELGSAGLDRLAQARRRRRPRAPGPRARTPSRRGARRRSRTRPRRARGARAARAGARGRCATCPRRPAPSRARPRPSAPRRTRGRAPPAPRAPGPFRRRPWACRAACAPPPPAPARRAERARARCSPPRSARRAGAPSPRRWRSASCSRRAPCRIAWRIAGRGASARQGPLALGAGMST